MDMTKETFDKVSSKIGSKNLNFCGVMGEIFSERKQQTDDSQIGYKSMFSLWRKVPQSCAEKH